MTRKHREAAPGAASRRKFLAASGGLALGFTIVPRHVLGGAGFVPPSERVNVAGIGAGGMGGGDIATHARNGANIVALCDVDDERAAGSYQAFPKAARYKDFRVMFDKERDRIDAVTVGTPDHVHAIASMAAIRAGKHVYCQKPLTHTLHECRTLTKAAAAAGVATQMGNQGHATEGARLTNEWLLACKGGPRPVSNFDYAGPLTEIVLLGVLALRAPGTRIEWDSENLKVKNAPELNSFVQLEYRKGWTL